MQRTPPPLIESEPISTRPCLRKSRTNPYVAPLLRKLSSPRLQCPKRRAGPPKLEPLPPNAHPRRQPQRRNRRRARNPQQSNLPNRLNRPSRLMRTCSCALILLPNAGPNWASQAIKPTIGSKQNANCSKRLAPKTPSRGYGAVLSIPGRQSFTFSKSRLIANGFGIKPRTPASCRSSCARSSSPRPEINKSGGSGLGGAVFS